MSLFNFAYKNISRDFKTYLYHFFSCVFSVFVFFIFTTLAFHPALTVVDRNSSIGLVLFFGGFVSLIFSFVLILYSIGNFLKQRSRQFAVLNVIGTDKKQFNQLIFFENGIISALALGFGILLGIVFAKFFLMLAEKAIDLNLYFYLPIKALLVTVCLMGGLFLVISLLSPVVLRRKKIIHLLKKEDEAEQSHLLWVVAMAAVVLPITVYLHKALSSFVYPFYLISFLLGTYMVLNGVFAGYRLLLFVTKQNIKGGGLMKIANFKYWVHTNLKTMTITLVLFSIILSSFVLIVGAPRNVEEMTEKIMPYAFMYTAWDENVNEEEQVAKLEEKLKNEEGFKRLKIEYARFYNDDYTRDILLSNTMYNEVARFLDRQPIELHPNGYYMIGTDGKHTPVMGDLLGRDLAQLGVNAPEGADEKVIALSGYFSSVTVISDEKYNEISENFIKENIYALDINPWTTFNPETIGLFDSVRLDGKTETLTSAYRYYESEKLQRSILAYVGSILCISFLIGIASIIYSRLYTLAETEIKKYKVTVRVGMDKKTLKGILSSTVRWIFIIPFMGALALAWLFVLTINQYSLVSYTRIAAICSMVYVLIEVILYVVIQTKYQNKILKGVYKHY